MSASGAFSPSPLASGTSGIRPPEPSNVAVRLCPSAQIPVVRSGQTGTELDVSAEMASNPPTYAAHLRTQASATSSSPEAVLHSKLSLSPYVRIFPADRAGRDSSAGVIAIRAGSRYPRLREDGRLRSGQGCPVSSRLRGAARHSVDPVVGHQTVQKRRWLGP